MFENTNYHREMTNQYEIEYQISQQINNRKQRKLNEDLRPQKRNQKKDDMIELRPSQMVMLGKTDPPMKVAHQQDPEIHNKSPEQRRSQKAASKQKQKAAKALDVSFVSYGSLDSTARRIGNLAIKSVGSNSNNSLSKDGSGSILKINGSGGSNASVDG